MGARTGRATAVRAGPSVEPGLGLSGLPEPDAGDLFYDIEGHPYVGELGLEYLHGIGWEDGGEFVFDGWWAHTPAAERLVFERLVDFIVERRRQHPDLHVYHYAPYETTAIGKLMGRYGTREAEVDDLLRGGRVRGPLPGRPPGTAHRHALYSIKKLEPLYMQEREGEIGTGGSSIVAYENWLRSQDPQILVDIEAYNKDDVESTWRLRDWLEHRRQELIDEGVEVPRPARPTEPEDKPDDERVAELIGRLTFDREQALAEQAEREREALAAGTEVDLADGPTRGPLDDQRARWLMADLLQWHRREAKPEWWRYFERVCATRTTTSSPIRRPSAGWSSRARSARSSGRPSGATGSTRARTSSSTRATPSSTRR